MKKRLLLILLFFFAAELFSNNLPQISFSLEPKAGLSSFFGSDYLYTFLFYPEGKLNSRLDWKCNKILKTGLGARLKIGYFIFESAWLVNLPLECGKLYDSDWFTEGMKSSLSIHDVKNRFGYDFLGEIKVDFPITDYFSFIPAVSFFQMHSEFEAQKGIVWKGTPKFTGLEENVPWNSQYAVEKKVYGIELYNRISILFAGFDLEGKSGNFNFNFKARISPFLHIQLLDHHLGKDGGNYFEMEQKSWENKDRLFFAYNFGGGAGFTFRNKNSLNVKMEALLAEKLFDEERETAFEFSRYDFTISYSIKVK